MTEIWSGGKNGSGSCTTGDAGQCTLIMRRIKNSKNKVIFAVDSVTHASMIYQPADNWETDDSSKGTAITVNKSENWYLEIPGRTFIF